MHHSNDCSMQNKSKDNKPIKLLLITKPTKMFLSFAKLFLFLVYIHYSKQTALCKIIYNHVDFSNIVLRKNSKFKTTLTINSEDEEDDYIIKIRTAPHSNFFPTMYTPANPRPNAKVLLNQIRASSGNSNTNSANSFVFSHNKKYNLNYVDKNITGISVPSGLNENVCQYPSAFDNFKHIQSKNDHECVRTTHVGQTDHEKNHFSKPRTGPNSLRNSKEAEKKFKKTAEKRKVEKTLIVAWKEEGEDDEHEQANKENKRARQSKDEHVGRRENKNLNKQEIKTGEKINAKHMNIGEKHHKRVSEAKELKAVLKSKMYLKHLGLSIYTFLDDADEADLENAIKTLVEHQSIRGICSDTAGTPHLLDDIFLDSKQQNNDKMQNVREEADGGAFRSTGDTVTIPNDWKYLNSSAQWPLWNTRMPHAWQRFGTGAELAEEERPVIMVADSGVDITHEDLKDNIYINKMEYEGEEGVDDDNNGYVDDIYGINIIPEDNYSGDCGTRKKFDNKNLCDYFGHGTQVAGIVGSVGNNTHGTASPNWAPKILICKMTYRFVETFVCIDYAIQQKSRLSVHSYYNNNADVLLNSVWGVAFERAARHGHTVFFSAGNNGQNHDSYNSHLAFGTKYKNAINVAASTVDGDLAYFSDFGKKTITIAAPGASVFTTKNGGGYISAVGTSFAAPFAASVSSLMISYNPSLTYVELWDILVGTSIKKPDTKLTQTMAGGYINGEAAIESAVIGGRWIDVNTNVTNLILRKNSKISIPLTFNGYARGVYETDLVVELVKASADTNRDIYKKKEIYVNIKCDTKPYLDRSSLDDILITRSIATDSPSNITFHNMGGGDLYVQVLNKTINNITIDYSEISGEEDEQSNMPHWIVVPEYELTHIPIKCNNELVGTYTATFSLVAVEGPFDDENIYTFRVICNVLPLKISDISFDINFQKT